MEIKGTLIETTIFLWYGAYIWQFSESGLLRNDDNEGEGKRRIMMMVMLMIYSL